MVQRSPLYHRLTHTATAVLALFFSFILLIYIGLGEAHRTYPTLVLDKIAAQGAIVQSSLQTFVVAGLPLRQFPGFTPLTASLLQADDSILEFRVVDDQGTELFRNQQPETTLSFKNFEPSWIKTSAANRPEVDQQRDTGSPVSTPSTPSTPSTNPARSKGYDIEENADAYRVTLPLCNKFAVLGTLKVTTSKGAINRTINRQFVKDGILAGICLVAYAILAFIAYGQWAQQKAKQWTKIAFSGFLLAMSLLLMMTLLNIYTGGIQGRTQALTESLAGRLNAAIALGLRLEDFNGIDQTFRDYQTLNPDLSFISLTMLPDPTASYEQPPLEEVLIHTDAALIGQDWQASTADFAYAAQLQDASRQFIVRLGVPWRFIYSQLWRSAKNFLVLFIASAFVSILFLNLMSSFTGRRTTGLPGDRIEAKLKLIGPLFFLAVFAEGLSVPLLPPYFQTLAQASQVSSGLVSTLFTTYFAFFVLALLPGGRWAQTRGTKPLLLVGGGLATGALLLMAVTHQFYAMFVLRAMAGFGQGLLYIGVQSYILAIATTEKKTQGTAIIVVNYNSAMLSGTAIGSLLAVYMGTQGVFVVGGLILGLGLLYARLLIPTVKEEVAHSSGGGLRGFVHRISYLVKDKQFLAGMFFVGIPTRVTLTGVTIFALPLVLSRQNYPPEDVGQILMFYAMGVLISSRFTSKVADRTGAIGKILFVGTVGSGIGLILIGLLEWQDRLAAYFQSLPIMVLVAGMIFLGLAHGFINAPIVTYITDTPTASILGKGATASLYRLLERTGHVLGPILLGQFLLLNQGSAFTISWLGVLTLGLGLLFAVSLKALPKAA
ncbi:MAG: MFS transporter [Leptolyngbyaceae cyanobacterium]